MKLIQNKIRFFTYIKYKQQWLHYENFSEIYYSIQVQISISINDKNVYFISNLHKMPIYIKLKIRGKPCLNIISEFEDNLRLD